MKKLSLLWIVTLLLVLWWCFSKKDVIVTDASQTWNVELTWEITGSVDANLSDDMFAPSDNVDVTEIWGDVESGELDADTQEIFDAYSNTKEGELTEDDIDFAEKVIEKVQEISK